MSDKTTGEKIRDGELVVMMNIDHELLVTTPEEAREIRAKQIVDYFNNSFTSQFGDEGGNTDDRREETPLQVSEANRIHGEHTEQH